MFSDFLMTEYGLISIFKVRIMYGLKTAKILVRVCDGVRVTFKIEVRVRSTRTPGYGIAMILEYNKQGIQSRFLK